MKGLRLCNFVDICRCARGSFLPSSFKMHPLRRKAGCCPFGQHPAFLKSLRLYALTPLTHLLFFWRINIILSVGILVIFAAKMVKC